MSFLNWLQETVDQVEQHSPNFRIKQINMNRKMFTEYTKELRKKYHISDMAPLLAFNGYPINITNWKFSLELEERTSDEQDNSF